MTDITNVLGFLQSMPKELGTIMRITEISSDDSIGKHRVYVKTDGTGGGSTLPFIFFFSVDDDSGDLKIANVWRAPIPQRKLHLAARLVLEAQKKRAFLGNGYVATTKSSDELAVVAECRLPVHDAWFASENAHTRLALVDLIANTMRRLTEDGMLMYIPLIKLMKKK